MQERIKWNSLPASVRDAIGERAGHVSAARTVSQGMNSALAAVLDTSAGRVFVKGIRQDYPGVVAQQREATINPHVRPLAPALLWRLDDVDGWDVLAFEFIEGRHPNYAPGSADLLAVLAALDTLAALPLPDLPLKDARRRWHEYLDADDAELLGGETLLHTDYNPDNILITADGTARMIDWAWPTRGAAWIDPCCLALRLIAAGHTAAEAEQWVARTRAWADAPRAALDVFARANVDMWADIAASDPQPWKQRMADAARQWADARLVPTSR
ncbi:phosphotransferase family protein [Actinokineospora sp. G85]|uniref:phosphotransferase family protein n=1 Tax=Actinokineospora sp. G85 TaxID=3406626 RepID=UPI003C71869C